jgi:hypothetical protein
MKRAHFSRLLGVLRVEEHVANTEERAALIWYIGVAAVGVPALVGSLTVILFG